MDRDTTEPGDFDQAQGCIKAHLDALCNNLQSKISNLKQYYTLHVSTGSPSSTTRLRPVIFATYMA